MSTCRLNQGPIDPSTWKVGVLWSSASSIAAVLRTMLLPTGAMASDHGLLFVCAQSSSSMTTSRPLETSGVTSHRAVRSPSPRLRSFVSRLQEEDRSSTLHGSSTLRATNV